MTWNKGARSWLRSGSIAAATRSRGVSCRANASTQTARIRSSAWATVGLPSSLARKTTGFASRPTSRSVSGCDRLAVGVPISRSRWPL